MEYQKKGYHRGVNKSNLVEGFHDQDSWRVSQRPLPRSICHTMRETHSMDRGKILKWILGGHSHSHLSKSILW